jgi:tripartite ATP-independent transporter DctM subunit
MAGVFPGILEALIYLVTIYILCTINPLLGPPGPKTSFREKIIAIKDVWAVVVLFVGVLGGLYLGVFTPTEAAGAGAFGALVLSLARRQLNWNTFVASLVEASKTTAMIFFIIIGAKILGYFLAVTRVPFLLADIIGGLAVNPWISFGIILFIYLILGCVMDGLAMVLLTIPIFYPVVVALGFDPIWFGVIHLKIVEIGLITPPIGINVFVISGVAKDVPLQTIYRGVMPFVIADLFHLGLLLAFPAISLFLPSFMN